MMFVASIKLKEKVRGQKKNKNRNPVIKLCSLLRSLSPRLCYEFINRQVEHFHDNCVGVWCQQLRLLLLVLMCMRGHKCVDFLSPSIGFLFILFYFIRMLSRTRWATLRHFIWNSWMERRRAHTHPCTLIKWQQQQEKSQNNWFTSHSNNSTESMNKQNKQINKRLKIVSGE